MFNWTEVITPVTEGIDLVVSKQVIKLWTNFAAKGYRYQRHLYNAICTVVLIKMYVLFVVYVAIQMAMEKKSGDQLIHLILIIYILKMDYWSQERHC